MTSYISNLIKQTAVKVSSDENREAYLQTNFNRSEINPPEIIEERISESQPYIKTKNDEDARNNSINIADRKFIQKDEIPGQKLKPGTGDDKIKNQKDSFNPVSEKSKIIEDDAAINGFKQNDINHSSPPGEVEGKYEINDARHNSNLKLSHPEGHTFKIKNENTKPNDDPLFKKSHHIREALEWVKGNSEEKTKKLVNSETRHEISSEKPGNSSHDTIKDKSVSFPDFRQDKNENNIDEYNLTIGTINVIIDEPKNNPKKIIQPKEIKKEIPGKKSSVLNRYYLRV